MDIVQQIDQLVRPSVEEAGLELVDIEYRREPIGWVLRFYMDKPGGLGLSDCTDWNDRLGLLIEAAGLMKNAYSLEISSPGLSRPLKKRDDFQRFIGLECVLKTLEPMNNQRNFRGKMASLEGDDLMLVDRTSGLVRIPLSAVAHAKLDPEI
jgi:ribosome maturation factor RimP